MTGAVAVPKGYRIGMPMNVRFTDDELADLQAIAEAENRSMQTVARAAVREYINRREHRDEVADALAVLVPLNEGLLLRLRDA